MADEPQEKLPLLLPFSDASEVVQQNFCFGRTGDGLATIVSS
jgi:hypothetical protein